MRNLHLGSSLAILLMAGTMGAAYGADYTPVTDARLANPEPQNWLMTRGNYARLELQPARPDQHLKRQEPGPGVERFDRGRFRP